MSNHSHRSNITNLEPGVTAAVNAINTLKLQQGVDKEKLIINLSKYLVLLHNTANVKKRFGRETKIWSKSVIKEITKLQMMFDAKTNGIEIELIKFAGPQGKYSVLDDAYKGLEKLQTMSELLASLPPFKSGNKMKLETSAFGHILAKLYHEATGKVPGHKSGGGSGPFYRFVEAATANTVIKANTVTRRAIESFNDRKNDTPLPQKHKDKNLAAYFGLKKKN